MLVVEDEEKVRVLLNDAFRAEGHDVTEATTGAEALKHLDKSEFDLMVCDLGLPELSGLHVARWVKEFRPDLPVIIATGYAEMIAEEDYQKARIDDVIRKPYALADVLNRAHALLAAQPETRETVTLGKSSETQVRCTAIQQIKFVDSVNQLNGLLQRRERLSLVHLCQHHGPAEQNLCPARR